jgi:Ca2+-binding EF-hand superfamily protein
MDYEGSSMKQTLALILVLACSTAVMAGPGKNRFMGHFDTNNDGKVTQAEFDKAAAKTFTAIDTNGDGKLTFDEYRTYKKNKHFARMDANKDGKVSKKEFTDYKIQKVERMFTHKDTNNDGFISKDEMASKGYKACKHHDKHHGKHHGKHAGGHHGNRAMRTHHKFMAMDENNDGVVTRDEKLKSMSNKFKNMDANNDKVVTQAEVDAYRKKKREQYFKK